MPQGALLAALLALLAYLVLKATTHAILRALLVGALGFLIDRIAR